MKTYNIILFILVFLLTVNLASAEVQTLGTYKIDSCINLKQICNCSYVNITTILYPNSTIALSNVEMIKTGTDFVYNFCNTSLLGNYIVNGYGDPDTTFTVFNYDFEITQTGYKQTTSEGIGSAIFLILILSLTVLFGFMGFKFVESDTLWALGIFFLGLSLLFVVYDVYLGYEYHLNYIGSANDSRMPETIFYIFMIILTAGLMSGAVLLFKNWKKIKDIYTKKDSDGWDGNKF